MSPTRPPRIVAKTVSHGSRWPLILGTISIVMLLLYAGMLLLSRTDGFRHLVEQHLRTTWGKPQLEIDRVWCDLMLRLVVEGVRQPATPPNLARFEIQELRVSGILTGWWPNSTYRFSALTVRGADADLQRKADGEWHPPVIAGLAKYIGARIGLFSDLDVSSPPLTSRHFHLTDTTIRWRDQDGHGITQLEGVDYETDSAILLGQTVRLERLTIERSVHNGREIRMHRWSNL